MIEYRRPLLKHVLPDLTTELEADLRKEREHALADSVEFLRIYGLCGCSDTSCGSFYTGPKPDGAFGPGHRTVLLDSASGMTLLDVVNEVVRYVELIDRPEIRSALNSTGLS